MNGSCTAHIAVTMYLTSSVIKADFCSHHVGHGKDLGHLHLSSEMRSEIAALLHQGVTVSKIMDTMRNRVGQTLQRDALLCRLVMKSDMHNAMYMHHGLQKQSLKKQSESK